MIPDWLLPSDAPEVGGAVRAHLPETNKHRRWWFSAKGVAWRKKNARMRAAYQKAYMAANYARLHAYRLKKQREYREKKK